MAADITSPIVVDLGTARREHIKDLHNGSGPLIDDIQAAMAHIHANAALASPNRVFVPVVVVYTEAEGDDEDALDDDR